MSGRKAKLENGEIVEYDNYSDTKKSSCSNLQCLGRGTIHSINGEEQDNTDLYYFFVRK